MFKTIGVKSNIKNIITICKPFLSNNTTKTELKNAYRNFLKKAQPSVPRKDTQDISFLHRPQEIKSLLKIFEGKSILDDFEAIFDSSDLSEQEFSIKAVMQSLEEIQEIDSAYYNLIQLAINTIFSAPSKFAGGGSTSAAIGCIWVNLRKHWQKQDILEFLIHETTHNLVFLDELCYSHYSNYSELPKEENFSWSAILNKPRPLDKVFHSIIVSTEILLFRNEYLGHPDNPCLHPPSDIMLDQLRHSIDYLKKYSHLRNLLSQRANNLLNICENKLEILKLNSLCCG